MTQAVQEGIVVVVARAGRLLMIRRAAHIFAGGAWCFVGGGIEPGENQSAAAVREFREEVGGAVQPVRKIWEYDRPDGRLKLHWWLCELGDGELSPNANEVAEVRWCSPAEIIRLPELLDSNRAFMARLESAITPAELNRP